MRSLLGILLVLSMAVSLSTGQANGNFIDVRILPDHRPLIGDEVTIEVDLGALSSEDLATVGSVVAHVDTSDNTSAPAVDINGAGPGGTEAGSDLELGPVEASGDPPARYSAQTNGLDGIVRAAHFHVVVTASTGGGQSLVIATGESWFDTGNLRIEATTGVGAGKFDQIFKPGDTVRYKAKVLQEGVEFVSVNVLNIFAYGPQEVELDGPSEGLWTSDVTLSDPADYLADALLVDGHRVPIEPDPIRFTTDPVRVGIGVVASPASPSVSQPKQVLVPVFIGTGPNDGDNVYNKDILATDFEIGFDHGALIFEGVLLLDGIAESSDHRVVYTEPSQSVDHIRITTAGASGLSGEGPLYYLKFRVGTSDEFPPGDGLADVWIDKASLETERAELIVSPIVAGGVSALVGDVNHSGQITAYDGIIILKWLVGLYPENDPFHQLDERVANVNRDGRISALDAALIFRYDAGLITELPPPGPQPKLVSPVAQSVGLADASLSGADLVVPVRVSDLAGLMAADLTLSYNPSAFEVSGIVPGASLDGWSVASNQTEGKIRIALAGANSVQGEGDLAVITLRPLSDRSLSTSPLTITRAALNDQVVRIVAAGNGQSTPEAYSLLQNSPNPFNPETQVSYNLPRASSVTLAVYDLTGQAIRTLVSAQQAAGSYTVSWDGRDDRGQAVASGAYVYRLTAGSFSATKKMVMMK